MSVNPEGQVQGRGQGQRGIDGSSPVSGATQRGDARLTHKVPTVPELLCTRPAY